MSNKGQLLQDPFLNTLRKEHVPVSIYLVNGPLGGEQFGVGERIGGGGHLKLSLGSVENYCGLVRRTLTTSAAIAEGSPPGRDGR